MNVWEIAGGIAMLLLSIIITIIVTLQESPKGSGISAITGGDSYYNRNQGRTRDALLSRWTKIACVAFFVVTIAVYALYIYMP